MRRNFSSCLFLFFALEFIIWAAVADCSSIHPLGEAFIAQTDELLKLADVHSTNNTNVAYDPDVNRTITEMIRVRGYPVEEHHTTTQDGYILTMFRIPHGRTRDSARRGVFFLQHGLLDSSVTWFINYHAEQCLPFILADAGYDVWMGNNRGNTYSKRHTRLRQSDAAFWDFSFDELAEHDITQMITYVSNHTASRIEYVGHSQGSLQMFLALINDGVRSNFTTLAPRLQSFYALGPVLRLTHMRNWIIRLIVNLHGFEVLRDLGFHSFLPAGILPKYFPAICQALPHVCDSVVELIVGWHHGSFNVSRMQVMTAHEPGGASMRDMQHFGQWIRHDHFGRFDFGREGNLKRYGAVHPPHYDIAQLKHLPEHLHLALFGGGADLLAAPKDVDFLRGLVPHAYHEEISHYAHLDFCWGVDAKDRLYNKILDLAHQWAQ